MAVSSTQSALRSAPLRPEPAKSSTRLLESVIASWKKLSAGARVTLVGLLSLIVLSGAGIAAWRSATRPVPLYATMTTEDIAQISPRLLAMGVRYNVEGATITVDPAERTRIVGALLAFGFPRYRPAAQPAGGMLSSDAQRREQAISALRADLIAQIQQFESIAFADVNIAPGDPEAVPAVKARASILVSLRPGAHAGRMQVQAVVNLVASAVPGLDPADVKVVDTSGRVWNEGLRVLADDDGAADDERLLVKRAYETLYRTKLREAFDRAVGPDNSICAVNAELDFSRVKVVETRLGGPMGGERVVLQSDDLTEKLERGKDTSGPYEKRHVREKVEVGKAERTAIIEPGAVERLSASVIVDGQRSAAELETLRTLARGAVGHEADVEVRCMALPRTPELPTVPASPAVAPRLRGLESTLLLLGLVPSLLLLAAGGMWLARTREARARQSALELRRADDAATRGIADLVNDRLGTRDRTITATAASTTSLESLARDRPSRVADLLRSTWLSDRER